MGPALGRTIIFIMVITLQPFGNDILHLALHRALISTDGPHLNSMLVLQEAGAKLIRIGSDLLKKVQSLSILSGELLQF